MLPNTKIRIYLVGWKSPTCWKSTKKTHQNNVTDIGTLRNVDIALVFSLVTLKRFYTFSWHFTVEFEACYRLGLPTEIKVQTSKNYETCKSRCKSYHINQTDQTTTWKETCVEFKKYAKCKLWTKIYQIYWDFCFIRTILL